MKLTASFLMPVRNDEHCVLNAIYSVLCQSDPNFQFIIVDDASDRPTRNILNRVAKADSRIILIRNEKQQGITKSLNIGAARCDGDIIVRIDSDDLCMPDRLYWTKKAFLSDKELSVFYSGYHVHTTDGHQAGYIPGYTPFIANFLMPWVNKIAHPSASFTRSAFEKAGGYDDALSSGQDHDLWLRMLQKSYKFSCHRKPLVSVCKAMKSYRNPSISNYSYAVEKFVAANGRLSSYSFLRSRSRIQILYIILLLAVPRVLLSVMTIILRSIK